MRSQQRNDNDIAIVLMVILKSVVIQRWLQVVECCCDYMIQSCARFRHVYA